MPEYQCRTWVMIMQGATVRNLRRRTKQEIRRSLMRFSLASANALREPSPSRVGWCRS